jgi:pimeloyl-ACP methyl ester carboxylesterase
VPELQLDPPPDLTIMAAKGETRAVALLLPGGSGAEEGPGDRYRPSVLRMLPFGWSLQRAGHRRGLTVALLRYRVAGWKTGAPGAAEDTRWALAQLLDHFGPVPVVLVGHSMGGRTALATADEKSVIGVVALAPWIDGALQVGDLAGRRVVLAHGDQDRVTSPAATAAFAGRARADGVDVELVAVPGDGHAMLKTFGTWQRLVRDRVLEILAPALR